MKKNLREMKKIKRKTLILQEFGKLIGKKGLNNFTMKDIADNLEISLRTLYNYYENKNDLVADYLCGLLIDILEKVEDKSLPSSANFVQDVNALLSSFFNLPFPEQQIREIWQSYFMGSIISKERVELFQKVDRLCIELVCKIVDNHKEKLLESSYTVGEIFYILFTTCFTKFILGEKSIAEAQRELKDKIEIVYKGVQGR